MKPPRNPDGQISPVALGLLLGILALPFVYYLLPDTRIWTDPNFSPPRYEFRWSVPAGDPDAAPTRGMTLDSAGRASIYDAPQLLPVETYGSGKAGFFPDPLVQPDIARFIRAQPREIRVGRPHTGERVSTCTLEGEAQYAGRIVLHNGCLRLQIEGEGEGEGEPGAQLRGVGCSRDAPVKAPLKLAKLCQANTLVRIGTIRREAICPEDRIAELVKQAGEYRILNDRLRAENAACMAQNGAGALCPPAAAPMPPPISQNCRMPDGMADRLERAMRAQG